MPWLVLRAEIARRWGGCPPWVVDDAPDGYVEAELALMAAELRGETVREQNAAERQRRQAMMDGPVSDG